MVGALINALVGIAFVLWGLLCLQQSPLTDGMQKKIQDAAGFLFGGEFHVPFYVTALVFFFLGGLALLNAFMMLAARYGFWI